jgi:hypothetical protein
MARNCLILLLMLLIPGTAGAANLYLKDGGIIECILAKRQNGTVYVLVNRYTEVELDRSEVDISKTFKGKQSIGSYRRSGKSSRLHR